MSGTRALLGTVVICISVAGCLGVSAQAERLVRFVNAPAEADRSRLPVFRSSNARLDAFLNSYFIRHLTIDPDGVHWGTGPMLGATDHLWVIEWDCWMLPWVDRTAMGLARQGGSDADVILTTLSRCTIDKYGYVFGSYLTTEPNNSLGGYKPTFGWPWPKYNRNYDVSKPTGWEFNNPTDVTHEGWSGSDLRLEAGHPDHRLRAVITGSNPSLQSPEFACDVFQIPVVELDIEYRSASGADVRDAVNGLRLYWATSDQPEFDDTRSVGIGFSVLPPAEFPDDYAEMAGKGFARFALFFPMHLHREWGRQGRTITRLMVMPADERRQGIEIAVNYIRATYDVRMATTNAALINAAARFYLWSGDRAFLAHMMPRLRRAMLFLNEHLLGRREALICQDWFVGHDGRGGDRPGHGLIGSYWDLLPTGRCDLESSSAYYLALRNMAALEDACVARGIEVPSVSVVGPDNRTTIRYAETSGSLRRQADRVRRRIETVFWNRDTGRFCRNIDADGRKHDYGYVHLNLQALAWGIGTPTQARSILSWLDGRPIPGDTAIGSDIYRWRFAPRSSTRRNTDYYFWPWIWDGRNEVGSPYRVWGDQMQDGGAIPATALWEAMARCRSGEQPQIDRVYSRLLEVSDWYGDVSACGGAGAGFYRAYYDGHPERGKQQSPMPGGLGLDREFMSDAALGTIVPTYALLGLDVQEDGVLTISPSLPAGLDWLEVSNISFLGHRLTIRARRDGLSVRGDLEGQSGAHIRLVLGGRHRASEVTVDGHPHRTTRRCGRREVVLPLKECDVQWHGRMEPAHL